MFVYVRVCACSDCKYLHTTKGQRSKNFNFIWDRQRKEIDKET